MVPLLWPPHRWHCHLPGLQRQRTVHAPAGTFASVTAVGNHACALTSYGAIKCWGANAYGKASPPAGRFQSVEAGANHTCGVRSNGITTCWGRNHVGQASVPASFNQFD